MSRLTQTVQFSLPTRKPARYTTTSTTCTPKERVTYNEKGTDIPYPDKDFVGTNKGDYKLRIVGYDKLGNASVTYSSKEYMVDGSSPSGGFGDNSSKQKMTHHYAVVSFSGSSNIKYCWYNKSVESPCTPGGSISNGYKIEKEGTKGVEETWVLIVEASNSVGTKTQVSLEFIFDRKAPSIILYSYGIKTSTQAIQTNEVLMMSVSEEIEEVKEELDVVYIEEVIEKREEIVKEELIIKEVEIVSLTNEVIVNTSSNGLVILDYVFSTLRNSIFVGGGCFFVRDRKRIKVA